MYRRNLILPSLVALLALSSSQAQPMPPVPQPPAGSNWSRVQALPPHTGLHLTTDHGGHGCHVFAVSDDSLTCEGGGRKAGRVFQKAEIQHIKLTHYVRSTLVGAGVGGGIGAIAGAIGGRTPPCTGFCFNILGPGAVAAIVGTAGAVVGAAVGGPTDFARGSSIYVRP